MVCHGYFLHNCSTAECRHRGSIVGEITMFSNLENYTKNIEGCSQPIRTFPKSRLKFGMLSCRLVAATVSMVYLKKLLEIRSHSGRHHPIPSQIFSLQTTGHVCQGTPQERMRTKEPTATVILIVLLNICD